MDTLQSTELTRQGEENAQPAADQKLGNPLTPFSQSFAFEIDGEESQLSSIPQTNSEEELSIPREVISSSVSSTSLQSEILRPIIAGTYNGDPAYLLQLQFQFQTPGSGQNWLNRIQSASISVVVNDAPTNVGAFNGKSSTRSTSFARRRNAAAAGKDKGAPPTPPPAILKTFPGPEGWEGPISTAQVSREVGVGAQAGWNGSGAGVSLLQNRARDEKGTAKVTTMRIGGKQRNGLLITVMENPVDACGIQSYLVVPIIVVHRDQRFNMRVTVKAAFGFWRGRIAEKVPVLGRVDEPLFFDPKVLGDAIETRKVGIGGVKVAEWKGDLEGVDLREYSSL